MKITASGIILILLFTSTLSSLHSSQSSGSESLTMVEKAVNFLVNNQFNRSLGLCREAPSVANTYWLVSDNLWAWEALKVANECGLSNAAEAAAAADMIKARLIELAVQYGLPRDAEGLPISYAHEAVLGNIALPPYRTGTNSVMYKDDYVLNTTMLNGTVMSDWAQYADLLLYAALSYHWQGNDSDALGYYSNATKMWNETGIGLQDKAADETYNTYKLALLLYTSKVLGESLAFESELVDRIFSQQRESDGGLVTNYFANGTLDGDANTETTSISIIALLTPPKARLGTFAFYYPWYGTPSLSGYWRHWNDANHNPDNITDGRRDVAASDYPLLDVYDSNNETVIEQHVKWAKEAGIDCFVVSWWGINDFTDNASRHIRNVCERDDFNFTFYLENTTSINQTVEDLTYLLNQYGNSSSWYRVDGRPVIFVYSRARSNLNPQAWIWHACTDNIGNDADPNTTENAAEQWLPSEEVRKPPRHGIIPFQPFKSTPGYVESASPIHLQPGEEYWLNVGVSDIRNDSEIWSDVGVRIKIGLGATCNDTLYDQVVNFTDGWHDMSFNITGYAGQDVYVRAESYNGGLVNWSSEWAAVDYFFVNNSRGEIVSPDAFFDNGWNEVVREIRENGANPYVIMDFEGFEGRVEGFIDYFQEYIDGIHVYNPLDFSRNPLEVYDLYHEACELAHSYDKTFIATIVPGFNNVATSSNRTEAFEHVVQRRNGACYNSFWMIAHACQPDGYAITSFNEWHEGTEIEPSLEYPYVPESLSIILLTLIMTATLLLAVTVRRRKQAGTRRLRHQRRRTQTRSSHALTHL
ncbi:hypothetical protein COS86_08630 [Candidatus Bathyarchaeota archaeon CG07_land_8_20_14_0_80_47_9]|nr:MAG: hypothetical protein COS86_08630 [Candidatus Bathyarchaeota archaeon CG07_land_8_20_14_0_80_47_9]